MIRILVTALNAYPAVFPKAGVATGGLETFAWSITRQLAKHKELDVTFCVRETQRLRTTIVDGVNLVNLVEPLRKVRAALARDLELRNSFPGFRVRSWNPNLLWQIPLLSLNRSLSLEMPWAKRVSRLLQKLQPDILFCVGVNQENASFVTCGNALQIPSIVWLQSNNDLDSRYFSDDDFRNEYGVSSADAQVCLRLASQIICQTDWQLNQLQNLSETPAIVIRNPIDTKRFDPADSQVDDRKFVSWIGRYDQFHKRPHLAIDVAEQCPEIPFCLTLTSGSETVKQEIDRRRPENVTIQNALPHTQMPAFYRQSRIFMSTGSREHEGFPNVFLEAAACGTPICSLEDFDDFLQRSGAGISTDGDIPALARAVRQLWNDSSQWTECSTSGIRYVREHHLIDSVAQEFIAVITNMLHPRQRL